MTGVLIASGAFPIWLMAPAAFVAMALGMMAGYGWARTVGQSGLQSLAERLSATEVYDRAQARLKEASPWTIAVSRLIPGLRPYATLVSGAAEVEVRTFLLGALPALLLWEIVWIAIGMLVGLPVAHFLGRFEKLALRGVLLVILGVIVWFAVRNASEPRGGMDRVAPRLRASLAVAFDGAMVVTLVAGAFAIGDQVMDVTVSVWAQLVVSSVLLILLLVLGRRIQTPGETLFDTHYWHRSTATPQ